MSAYLTEDELDSAAVSPEPLPANIAESIAYRSGEQAGYLTARYYARMGRPHYRHPSPYVDTPYESDWWAGYDAGVAQFQASRKGDAV